MKPKQYLLFNFFQNKVSPAFQALVLQVEKIRSTYVFSGLYKL